MAISKAISKTSTENPAKGKNTQKKESKSLDQEEKIEAQKIATKSSNDNLNKILMPLAMGALFPLLAFNDRQTQTPYPNNIPNINYPRTNPQTETTLSQSQPNQNEQIKIEDFKTNKPETINSNTDTISRKNLQSNFDLISGSSQGAEFKTEFDKALRLKGFEINTDLKNISDNDFAKMLSRSLLSIGIRISSQDLINNPDSLKDKIPQDRKTTSLDFLTIGFV